MTEKLWIIYNKTIEPEGLCKIMIDFPFYLNVYIWADMFSMFECVGHDEGDFTACYIAGREDHLFGELHMLETFTAGEFSHELTHHTFEWIRRKYKDTPHHMTSAQMEETCEMIEHVTTEFWVWYYSTYKKKEEE